MKPTVSWQPQQTLDAIVFDCDGTLSAIEGIDQLAEWNGVGEEVRALTEQAMAWSGISPTLYARRLASVQPTLSQVEALAATYLQRQHPRCQEVVAIFQSIKKPVFVVSAGVDPAVTAFAHRLGVPHDRVLAVALSFDSSGHYVDFDRHSPLVQADGKQHILRQLKQQYPRLVLVGDGVNDLAARDAVCRFIGYGGQQYRERIAKGCDYYIQAQSLAPVLPLTLTAFETMHLREAERLVYCEGLELIDNGAVSIPLH